MEAGLSLEMLEMLWLLLLPLRYVRILGNMVHAIQIKTNLCQLVEVMMERRDDLSFCQEMKFRSAMVPPPPRSDLYQFTVNAGVMEQMFTAFFLCGFQEQDGGVPDRLGDGDLQPGG